MPDPLCTRLDAEPAIFRGCTSSELGVLFAAAVLLWLPTGFGLAGLVGAFGMGVGFAAIGVLGTVLATATWLARIKRNRPEAYYLHRVAVALHRWGLRRSPFILHTGPWDLGRTP
jgi:conjugative transfer region protein (TIGR03750 family)